MSEPKMEINYKEELDFYKEKHEKFEYQFNKMQTKIEALELTNRKLRTLAAENSKSIHNTTISFFLPSEIETLWEKCIEVELLDAFDNFINDYLFISNISQDLFLIIYQETENLIQSKINLITLTLNIKTTHQEKNNLLIKFIPLFQEYFYEIFVITNEFIELITNKLIENSISYKINFDKEELKECTTKNEFKNLIESVFKICMYMHLHEPKLTINIKKYSERKEVYMYFIKKEMTSIEGFGNESTPCLLVLPPPMIKKKFPYQRLKSAVIYLKEWNKNIIEECEKYKKDHFISLKGKNNNKNNDCLSNGSDLNMNNSIKIKEGHSKESEPNGIEEVNNLNVKDICNKDKSFIKIDNHLKLNDENKEDSYDMVLNSNVNNLGINNSNSNNNSKSNSTNYDSQRTQFQHKVSEIPKPIIYVNNMNNSEQNQNNQRINNNNDNYDSFKPIAPNTQTPFCRKKTYYNIPSFNIIRNKDISKKQISKEKTNSSYGDIKETYSTITQFQPRNRPIYLSISNSNHNSHINISKVPHSLYNNLNPPKSTAAQNVYADILRKKRSNEIEENISNSFRYCKNSNTIRNSINNGNLEFITSNIYANNEIEVNELRMKYNIKNETFNNRFMDLGNIESKHLNRTLTSNTSNLTIKKDKYYLKKNPH